VRRDTRDDPSGAYDFAWTWEELGIASGGSEPLDGVVGNHCRIPLSKFASASRGAAMMARRDKEPARRNVPLVRIFLSSPGDVADERTSARQLIDAELMKLRSLRGKLALELIAWDDPAAQIPMLATETPQESHGHAAARQPAQAERRALPFRYRVGVRGTLLVVSGPEV
jgi:hypothetical protein